VSTNITNIDNPSDAQLWLNPSFPSAVPRRLVRRSSHYSTALTLTVLGLSDVCVLISCFFASACLWAPFHRGPNVLFYASHAPLVVLIFLPVCMASGLYRVVGMNRIEELRRSATATSLSFLILAGSALLTRGAVWRPRAVVLLTCLQVAVALPVARGVVRRICGPKHWFGRSVVVLGGGETAERVIRALQKDPGLGLKPAVVLDDNPSKQELCGVPILGGLALAPELASTARLGYGILAAPGVPRARLLEVVRTCGQTFDRLLLIPDLLGMASLWVQATDLSGMLGLEIQHNLLRRPARILKRAVDIGVVAALSPFLVPACLIVGGLIKLTSRGPLFYGHTRIGQDSRTFKAWKFRTMGPNAAEVLRQYLEANPALAEEWRLTNKLKNDPRVTRLGRLLRRASLDELPQALNVLRGEMSLVGPRPIVTQEVERYGDDFALYCRVKPGITGLWQISGRNNTSYAERVALDQYYVRNWSIWLDLYVLMKTVRTVLTGDGAY